MVRVYTSVAMKTGKRRPRGEELNRGHLTEQDVRKIRDRLSYGATLATVAEEFRISAKNVWSIKVGRTWRHVL